MNPKEKADYIFDKMYYENDEINYSAAKICALICVEEMINSSRIVAFSSGKSKKWFDTQNKYLEDVKSEIKKL